MDHPTCAVIIGGLATAVSALAWAFWKALGWYRAEARARLDDLKRFKRFVD